MRIELVKSLRVRRAEAEEWDENRSFGVVAEATGRIITRGLTQIGYYPDEEEKVHEFLEGLKLARKGQADTFFVPPPADDDGMKWRNYSPMRGDMDDHKRSYLVICANGPSKQIYWAPAMLFAEDDDEEVGEYLERMGEVLGERFFILPQEIFMSEIGWKGGRLDEFDMVMFPNEGYGRRSIRRANLEVDKLKKLALRASVFVNLTEQEAIVSGQASYEKLWKSLIETVWEGKTLLTVAQTGGAERIRSYARDEELRRTEWLVPDEVDPSEAEDYISELLARGLEIEGVSAPLGAENMERVRKSKRPVVLQAVSPEGAVAMLPFYACQEVVRRILDGLCTS